MRKILTLISLAILLVFVGSYFMIANSNSKTVKVLFIGNSLTSANNLPAMIADIAKSNGNRVVYDSHTPGGTRLYNHASNSKVLQKIKDASWDFVVLQEQSQYPGFSQKQLSRDVFPFAKKLAEAVKKTNNRSKVVFYMTMAHRNGDPDNKNVSPELLTYEGMQKRINRCYMEMARDNKAIIAPVGEVWKLIRKEKPNLNLYADNVHPNVYGTYLAACVFYSTFFGETPIGLSVASGVNNEYAQFIQRAVDRIVSP
jgi:hypothetical protein